jgi:endonuclease/exonuclease/phosphatase family metal-dependent hydrolase
MLHHTLHVVTFNIHKGFTHFNARYSLQHQRDALRKLHADIIFLQEVQELDVKHNKHMGLTAKSGQLEYLADSLWPEFSYGKNSVYPAGHHGNALLSKFPITKSTNKNISAHSIEQRGMLHCEITIPNWDVPLHAVCVHLGLFAHWRREQMSAVADYVNQHVPLDAPVIIAGDFNDWSANADRVFAKQLHVTEVFQHHTGKLARSFPAWLPVLKMDRIYVRGFDIQHAEVHSGAHFLKVSDHAMLSTTITKK